MYWALSSRETDLSTSLPHIWSLCSLLEILFFGFVWVLGRFVSDLMSDSLLTVLDWCGQAGAIQSASRGLCSNVITTFPLACPSSKYRKASATSLNG